MKVLVIAAHMDDEVLGVGGTIAKHVAAGDVVHVCIVCKRAYDHKFDDAVTAQEEANALRAKEVLGYQQISFLRLRDELLDERLLDVIVPVEDCVQKFKPDLVYTHHIGDSNQDHRSVFRASMIACRSLSSWPVQRLVTYEVLSSTDIAPPLKENAFQPNFYVDINEFLPKKIEAMKAYERESKEFPHPRSSKGIEVLANKRGMEIGMIAAESFVVLRDTWK